MILYQRAVSIHPMHVAAWFAWTKAHAPKKLDGIRSITLAGPDHWKLCPSDVWEDIQASLPNLTAVAYQCQTPSYFWVREGEERINVDRRWQDLDIVERMRGFGRGVTVVVEGWAWLERRRDGDEGYGRRFGKEVMGIVRVARAGKEEGEGEGDGWQNGDLRVEAVQLREVVEKKREAGWRAWWEGEELKFFG